MRRFARECSSRVQWSACSSHSATPRYSMLSTPPFKWSDGGGREDVAFHEIVDDRDVLFGSGGEGDGSRCVNESGIVGGGIKWLWRTFFVMKWGHHRCRVPCTSYSSWTTMSPCANRWSC